MSKFKFCMLVAGVSLVAATTVQAETQALVKRGNFFETQPAGGNPTSPWFNLDVAGAALSQSLDANQNDHALGHIVSTKPSVTGVQAGQVSSVTVISSYSIKGWAEDGPSFDDDNGIPLGITMTFKTSMTFSVDEGNFLTLSPAAGNGLGITQTQGTSSNLDAGEVLHVSDIQITDIAFTGSVAGYTFSNPTITNFGLNVLRSGAGTDFAEGSENAGLYSVPPDVSGNPTIGFGDGASGMGVVQSNVKIDNGFDAAGTSFTNRYQGAWNFKIIAGSMGLRGIDLKYDLGYDIVPTPVTIPGDYNQNGTVDAADYVLWRKGDLAADSNGDTFVDQADYDFWRTNFGNPGAGAGSVSAVPEPATLMLVTCGLAVCGLSRRSATRRS